MVYIEKNYYQNVNIMFLAILKELNIFKLLFKELLWISIQLTILKVEWSHLIDLRHSRNKRLWLLIGNLYIYIFFYSILDAYKSNSRHIWVEYNDLSAFFR